jgi:hypothetical protein
MNPLMFKTTKSEFLSIIHKLHTGYVDADADENIQRLDSVDEEALKLYDRLLSEVYEHVTEVRQQSYQAGYVDAAIKYSSKEALFRRLN